MQSLVVDDNNMRKPRSAEEVSQMLALASTERSQRSRLSDLARCGIQKNKETQEEKNLPFNSESTQAYLAQLKYVF